MKGMYAKIMPDVIVVMLITFLCRYFNFAVIEIVKLDEKGEVQIGVNW